MLSTSRDVTKKPTTILYIYFVYSIVMAAFYIRLYSVLLITRAIFSFQYELIVVTFCGRSVVNEACEHTTAKGMDSINSVVGKNFFNRISSFFAEVV